MGHCVCQLRDAEMMSTDPLPELAALERDTLAKMKDSPPTAQASAAHLFELIRNIIESVRMTLGRYPTLGDQQIIVHRAQQAWNSDKMNDYEIMHYCLAALDDFKDEFPKPN